MPSRYEILNWCNNTLNTTAFKDYAPNGLQVEGKTDIRKIVTSVTASLAAIEFAVSNQADMLLVHHGMFWKSEPVTITGWKKARIAKLLEHQINLAAYHLPLDAHPELGNNAQLAKHCGWLHAYSFGEQNLLNIGRLPENQATLADVVQTLTTTLGKTPIAIGNPEQIVRRIAWCTGGAQGFFQAASDAGADVYVSGEISEAQYHLANETGTSYISAGHHATERYGILALGNALADNFGIKHLFFDEANPA